MMKVKAILITAILFLTIIPYLNAQHTTDKKIEVVMETNKNQNKTEYNIEQLMKTTGSIGAYSKEADDAFGNLIRKTSFGDFDRVDWQLINFLHTNPKTTKSSIVEFMSFLASQNETEARIKNFETKRIISTKENDVLLTTVGEKAFDEAYSKQKEILDASFNGISKEQYEICIGVLKKMIENMSPYTRKADN